MTATEPELLDRPLLGEVDLARAAAEEEAGDEEVGAHVGAEIEAETAVTHLFEAAKPGYHGWRWAVTVASAGPDTDVTVSEVVLLPGPHALVAPDWVPWENRVKAGDLGVGDLLPTAPDDPRLVPAYVESDDPAVEEVAREVGLGRPRVMARPARLDAAARWQHSEFGPRSDMARSAPAHCGTCGFYLPLAGSLRVAFGTCGNEISPADGHVVHAEYGCGAHSEAEVEQVSPVLVANLIYDDARLDVESFHKDAPAAESPGETAAPEVTSAATEGTAAEVAATGVTAVAEVAAEPELVSAGAVPRELSGEAAESPAPEAAEPTTDDAGSEPEPPAAAPAAEAAAPLEPVVTAETSIDAPAGTGAPAALTPWIRPEGAAKQGDLPAPEPTTSTDHPAAAAAEERTAGTDQPGEDVRPEQPESTLPTQQPERDLSDEHTAGTDQPAEGHQPDHTEAEASTGTSLPSDDTQPAVVEGQAPGQASLEEGAAGTEQPAPPTEHTQPEQASADQPPGEDTQPEQAPVDQRMTGTDQPAPPAEDTHPDQTPAHEPTAGTDQPTAPSDDTSSEQGMGGERTAGPDQPPGEDTRPDHAAADEQTAGTDQPATGGDERASRPHEGHDGY